MSQNGSTPPVTIEMATEGDRPAIYRFRHQVYATELGQHPENLQELLTDPLDAYNIYIKASFDGRLAGFISITPPGSPSFSVDKYFPRESLFFPFDNGLFEVRLLTVMPDARRRTLAPLLMYAAVGEDFDQLARSKEVISADVLDAWFPPAPGVLAAVGDHLPFLLQTSPPTDCAGMVRAIARARHLSVNNIVPAAGSSELIFLCFREWLTRDSRVLLLDPTYSEYDHVCAQVIGCRVDYLRLRPEDDYAVDLWELTKRLQEDYDLAVLVNPNSPTGKYVRRSDLEALLGKISPRSRVWIDETYVDYVGEGASLERFAAQSRNVLVCKSMSKVYALSGARAAYLCAHPETITALRAITPPWAVSLPAQVAAVKALADPGYYAARYQETHALRAALAGQLRSLGIAVIDGMANFLLCHLPDSGPEVATIRGFCESRKLFLRGFGNTSLGRHAFRIAVKDESTNVRMVEILREALHREW